jgi:hypothetical protein
MASPFELSATYLANQYLVSGGVSSLSIGVNKAGEGSMNHLCKRIKLEIRAQTKIWNLTWLWNNIAQALDCQISIGHAWF